MTSRGRLPRALLSFAVAASGCAPSPADATTLFRPRRAPAAPTSLALLTGCAPPAPSPASKKLRLAAPAGRTTPRPVRLRPVTPLPATPTSKDLPFVHRLLRRAAHGRLRPKHSSWPAPPPRCSSPSGFGIAQVRHLRCRPAASFPTGCALHLAARATTPHRFALHLRRATILPARARQQRLAALRLMESCWPKEQSWGLSGVAG
jgi:hypothetical protein